MLTKSWVDTYLRMHRLLLSGFVQGLHVPQGGMLQKGQSALVQTRRLRCPLGFWTRLLWVCGKPPLTKYTVWYWAGLTWACSWMLWSKTSAFGSSGEIRTAAGCFTPRASSALCRVTFWSRSSVLGGCVLKLFLKCRRSSQVPSEGLTFCSSTSGLSNSEPLNIAGPWVCCKSLVNGFSSNFWSISSALGICELLLGSSDSYKCWAPSFRCSLEYLWHWVLGLMSSGTPRNLIAWIKGQAWARNRVHLWYDASVTRIVELVG